MSNQDLTSETALSQMWKYILELEKDLQETKKETKDRMSSLESELEMISSQVELQKQDPIKVMRET